MNFFVSLQPCPHCGNRVDPEPLKIYGDTTSWALTGDCASCHQPVAFTFRTFGDPIQTEKKWFQLGPGRSEIITPAMFVAEIERILPTITADVTTLAPKAWTINRDTNRRLTICVTELSRFLEPDGPGVPDVTRAWIEEKDAFQKSVWKAVEADVARIAKLEEAEDARRPKGINYLEREHLQAHEAWVERGKKGKGKLVLVGAEHEDMKVGRGVELSGATFFEVSMPGVYLDDAKLVGAELTDAAFERGQFYGAELRGAKITRGSFRSSNLETAGFQGASIDGTDFTETELHLTEWTKALVTNATFERASFGDANLDGATFKSCNFKGADMSADEEDSRPTTKAVFEDCDFRDSTWTGRDLSGATFIRCKLAGMSGAAAALEGVAVKDADISAADADRIWRPS